MHRREVLSFLGAAVLSPLLAPLSAQDRFAVGARLHQPLGPAGRRPPALTAMQQATLIGLCDTIIPTTDTPGAVDVGVPEFVDRLIAEWYGDADKAELLGGLDGLEERSRAVTGKGFAETYPAGRAEFLRTIDGKDGARGSLEAAYRRLKDAIIFGYVTSKPIAALRSTTPIIPGRYDGCVPIGKPQ
jgi:gluconate 2-dehydrogenase gamma chain